MGISQQSQTLQTYSFLIISIIKENHKNLNFTKENQNNHHHMFIINNKPLFGGHMGFTQIPLAKNKTHNK